MNVKLCHLGLILIATVPGLCHAAESLTTLPSPSFLSGSSPTTLAGKAAGFDFMEVDSGNDRLLAAHSGAGQLAIIDLKTGKSIPPVEVGNVQGVAVDLKSGIYILGDADEQKIVFVSTRTLKKIGELNVDGPVDAIAFDSKNGFAYAGQDDGDHIWVVDVKKQSLVTTIPVSGVPEFIGYDLVSDRLYQNIKNKNSVSVINPKTNKVEAEWSTLPATGPHGLAIDSAKKHLFIAGHNGQLVEIDIASGKVVSQVAIAPGTDQISFDSNAGIIYCASKGFISAVKETSSGLQAIGDTPTAEHVHTLAVDSSRHQVWVSYADKEHSYLQKFTSSREVSSDK
jgi:DNA-binding beta-propeller fold protein YncE